MCLISILHHLTGDTILLCVDVVNILPHLIYNLNLIVGCVYKKTHNIERVQHDLRIYVQRFQAVGDLGMFSPWLKEY
jgi:hypothetical protein